MQEYLIVKGANENNLNNVNIKIPKNKIVAFVGASGSGKSSLVFDTIASESKRQLNETFSWWIRNKMEKIEPANVESIENLSMAIIVDQKQISGGIRSTVGTITDVDPLIRLLFSRAGEPSAGGAHDYSFNTIDGMCKDCKGLGKKIIVDIDKMLDKNKSLNENAIQFRPFAVGWQGNLYKKAKIFDPDKPLNKWTEDEMNALLYGDGGDKQKFNPNALKVRVIDDLPPMSYEGLIDRFYRLYVYKDADSLSSKAHDRVLNFIKEITCPTCKGNRLNQKALATRINGYGISDYWQMEIRDLIKVLGDVNHYMGAPIAKKAISYLQRIVDIGLGYLNLARTTNTLSGGESQRVKIVRYLSNSLVNLLYIFDEPSAGLHSHDVAQLNKLLIDLRDKGNTVLVVEHDKDVISIADEVVEMGVGSGVNGGNIVFQGSYKEIKKSNTLTGQYLNKTVPIKTNCRKPKGFFEIRNSSLNNLKNINIDIPKGVMTTITGVAGSGKSSLRDIFIEKEPQSIVIDQGALSVNSRSNPATYIGIMDDIRNLFAKENNVSAGLFSFNSDGACPICKGRGEITPDMAWMEPISVICDKCNGSRYNDKALSYKLRGKNIVEVLRQTVNQSIDFFKEQKILQKLKALEKVGVGYITLGQSTDTLSGGECQRVKLASHLHKTGNIYVIDEPTTGLHPSDVNKLLLLLNDIVDSGNTALLIEHNRDVIRQSDWIIDIGPGGGKDGGKIIFEGEPNEIKKYKDKSRTGEYIDK
ncbi:MAG: excinuclease ABC subunit UvrA [Rickettsiales bacterium]|jgi:excinuclease UvrABC ATPase subunit|nr:excinuclease ABC subunit UvrA [Rickettsiales bacterium]